MPLGYTARAGAKPAALMKRRVVLVVFVALTLVLVAWPDAHGAYLGSDPFRDLTGSEAGGLMGRYPLSAYQLDNHIDSSTLPGSSWVEEVAAGLAQLLWMIAAFLVKLTISFVSLAFTLNIFDSSGPLRPITDATRHLHEDVLGNAPMVTMIIVLGLWGIKRAVWDQRHTEAWGGLALSALYILIALTLIFRPADTIGQIAELTNEASSALLVGANAGSLADPGDTRERIAGELWRANGLHPWTALEFGGLSHCVDQSRLNDSGYPASVPRMVNGKPNPDATTCRDHLRQVNGKGGYAWRFLRLPYKSDARGLEFEALKNGEIPSSPLAGDQFAGYAVDKADSPAVDIQQLGGGFNRLWMAIGIALCSVLFCWLFGMIALAIILTGVLALFLFAFAPIALFAAAMPGRGHGIFEGWALQLVALILVKAIFAVLITVLITMSIALTGALGSQGWVFAYGILAAFYALIWFYRNALMRMLGGRSTRREERTIRSTTEKTFAVTAAAVATPYATAKEYLHGRQEHTPTDRPEADLREAYHQPPNDEERSRADYQQRWSGSRAETPIPEARPDHPATPPATVQPAAGRMVSAPSETKGPAVSEQAGPGPVPSEPEGARPAAPTPELTPPPVAGLPPLQKPEVDAEFPGLSTPDSVVSPQRRAEHAPLNDDLAPPPEYRGPD